MASKNIKLTKTRKKSNAIKSKKVEIESSEINYPLVSAEETVRDSLNKTKSGFSRNLIGLFLIILILIAVFLVRKGYILSALVNGRPIFGWNLNRILNQRYGKQTLEAMITESLIEYEAEKNGISVTAQDIEARQNEILKNIGSEVSIDDLLKYQGLTREDFENQLKIQLAVEKILIKDINVTDSEVDNFIATNSTRLNATDAAELKIEAKKAITDERISKKMQSWFNDIREKAKIIRF